VLEPTEEPVRIIVFYPALVKVVELLTGGRMMQGDTTVLTRGGWSFKVREEEKLRAIAIATVLEDKLLAQPEPEKLFRRQEGLTYSPIGSPFDWHDKSYQLSDRRDRENHKDLSMGLGITEIKRRLQEDEAIFHIARPEDLMERPLTPQQGSRGTATGPLPGSENGNHSANSFTYSQKKKMKSREQAQSESPNLKSERLDPAFMENLRAGQERDGVSWKRKDAAQKAWMKKLVEGDFSGPTLDRSRYLTLRNQVIAGNPRQTEEYRKLCREAVGVGDKPDMERYAHLHTNDFDVIRWVVSRGSGCMWLPDTPRTTVKGFKHRLITRGPPIRGRLFRLNRADTEWIEKAIDEDVKRGQLEKGNSDWGFPAFPTKANPTYKAIQRSRRMVVDYRELNKVTVRKFFLIPNSDYIKSTVAGNEFISVGDLKEGFNQVDNEPETRKKMAVLSAGGCWLPRGLAFGPTNGPEDFQELVFTVFQRRLYKDWFLFVDDLSVATGRKKCHGDGPSGAHDVSCFTREETEGVKGEKCRSRRSGQAFHSPFAHQWFVFSLLWLMLLMSIGRRENRGAAPCDRVNSGLIRVK
jgi:hypothetical protein